MSDQADKIRARLDAVTQARASGQPFVPPPAEQRQKQEPMFQPAPSRPETAEEIKARLKRQRKKPLTWKGKLGITILVVASGLMLGKMIIVDKQTKERESRKQAEDVTRLLTQAIADKKIIIGMPAAVVRASWGDPDKINTSNYSGRLIEQWVYKFNNNYVYLENGVVTSWQNF
jgi:hypothetical protein